MRASRLRQTVVLQSYDGSAWNDVDTIPAEILPTGVSDGGTFQNYVVTLRWSEAVAAIRPTKELQATHKLIWDSKELEIYDAVNVDQRNREVRLQCKELLQPAS
jgi:hypothetical protein